MSMIQTTNYNEIIEFFKQFPILFNLVNAILIIILYLFFIILNFQFMPISLNLTQNIIIISIIIFLTYYLWKNGKKPKSKVYL